MSRIKQKSAPEVGPIIGFIEKYWKLGGLLIAISGSVWAFASLPTRVSALEKDASDIKQYIRSIEEDKELKKKSPIGFKWDEVAEEFVPYPDDPRLKKK